MRRGVCVIAVIAGLAYAAGASATESTVYPGVGIGKLRLGMTRAEVAHLLGPSSLVDERSRVGSAQYLQLGWDFDSWSVGFLRDRIVFVSTTLRAQRTSSGIGQGSTAVELLKAYPHGLCGLKHRELYLVTQPSGKQTLFRIGVDVQHLASGQTKATPRVDEVWVRTRFRPIEEFAPENRCPAGWEQPKVYP